jgi:hypothetical protein
MKGETMNYNYLRLALALIVALFFSLASPFWVSAGGKNSTPPPATALFRDYSADGVSSDGSGIYVNGKDCTTVTVYTSSFLLRTVKRGCTRGAQRKIDVNFTGTAVVGDGECPFMQCPSTVNDDFGQMGELNACGLNSLRDVTVFSPTMFRDTAINELNAVDIKINLEPDFTNTAFILRYGAYVRRGSTSNERILTTDADPADPIGKPDRGRAALIKITSSGEYVCLGEFYMPFAITVSK